MRKKPLKKCPIVENTVNLFCIYQIPVDVVIGVLYQLLSNEDKDIKLSQEPICNIPYDLRKNDPNLRNKATHRIITDKGQILIGEEVISIVSNIPYTTWEESSKFVYHVIDLLDEGHIIKTYNTINIRYLNFFSFKNIFDDVTLKISLNDNVINYPATIIKTEIPSVNNNFVSVLQIANSVHLKNDLLNIDDNGSLIDITVVAKYSNKNLKEIIEEIHSEEEEIFFNLLTDNFINTLE